MYINCIGSTIHERREDLGPIGIQAIPGLLPIFKVNADSSQCFHFEEDAEENRFGARCDELPDDAHQQKGEKNVRHR